MLDFLSFLFESVGLSAAELLKANSKTGEPRIDILRYLIKSKTPIELKKGGTVTVTDISSALNALDKFEDKPTNLVFKTEVGDVPLSQLAKSAIFGGGSGGAGGGSDQTRVTESAQCLWCAAMLESGNPNTEFEYFTDSVLKAAAKHISVDAKMEEMLNIPDQWKHSAHITAQLLLAENYISKGMTFHRGDRGMKSIYDAKNDAYKNQGLAIMKDDKWNPGDIWAMSPGFDIKSIPTDSVVALQRAILDLFVKRELVGISLKLVKKNPKTKEYNVKLPPDTDDYKIKAFGAKALTSGRGDFWSSKGGEIIYDAGKLSIKDGSNFGRIKVEIMGKTARGGGAGWGYIAIALEQAFKKASKLPGAKEIAAIARKIERGDKKAIEEMYKVVNLVEPMPYALFASKIKEQEGHWIHAKYGVCLLLAPIAKIGGLAANRFITKIINYAASSTEDSSAFVKVYQ